MPKDGRTFRRTKTPMPHNDLKTPTYYLNTSGCDDAVKILGYRPDCTECPLPECLDVLKDAEKKAKEDLKGKK